MNFSVPIKDTSRPTLFQVISKKSGIFERREEGLSKMFKSNIRFMKSPQLFAAFWNFGLGNFVVHIALALFNEVLRKKILIINSPNPEEPIVRDLSSIRNEKRSLLIEILKFKSY